MPTGLGLLATSIMQSEGEPQVKSLANRFQSQYTVAMTRSLTRNAISNTNLKNFVQGAGRTSRRSRLSKVKKLSQSSTYFAISAFADELFPKNFQFSYINTAGSRVTQKRHLFGCTVEVLKNMFVDGTLKQEMLRPDKSESLPCRDESDLQFLNLLSANSLEQKIEPSSRARDAPGQASAPHKVVTDGEVHVYTSETGSAPTDTAKPYVPATCSPHQFFFSQKRTPALARL